MAYNYNTGFPIGYQPAQIYYPQQQYNNPQQQYINQVPQTQTQQTISLPTIHAEIIQVDNEQAAENYPLAAGASQMMIAKDDSAIYVKTMFANGQYNLDVFTKRPPRQKQPEIDPNLYITRDEFETRLQALTKANTNDSKKEGAE